VTRSEGMKTGIYWQDPKYAVGQCHNDPSCVLYLPLHRLDGVSFMSQDAYGHLCTVTGDIWTPQGRSFDGSDDDVNCGTSSVLDITSAITLIVWLKINALSDQAIIYRLGTFGTNGYIIYAVSAGAYRFGSQAANRLTGNTTLVTGKWYCIGATQKGTSFRRLYINGIHDGETTSPDAIVSPGSASFAIGENIPGNLGHFNGLIGEVMVYSRALTPLEIQHNYLATKWRYR